MAFPFLFIIGRAKCNGGIKIKAITLRNAIKQVKRLHYYNCMNKLGFY